MAEQHQRVFIERLLNPEYIKTLYEDEIKVHLYESNGVRKETLKGITPFMTLSDIKIAIYDLMNRNEIAIPDYTFVCIKHFIGKKYTPFDYGWADPESPDKPLMLSNPAELIASKRVDTRFVDGSGSRKILTLQNRERMTIESSFKKIPELHVFFYKILEESLSKPIGEHSWNGYLYPYFPTLSIDPKIDVGEDIRLKGFVKKREFYSRIQKLLINESLYNLTMTGIRFLRIHYSNPKNINGIESVFYNAPVNSVRPYMRLLPVETTPISKLHMINDKPNIEDPRLLVQWGNERMITPDRDSVFAKILLRKATKNIPPLYCTLRLLDDGTADVTVEPPRSVRKLDPRSELDMLPATLQAGLDGFSYLDAPNHINGTFVFGVNLKDVAQITQKSIREKLPIFSSIFQEIPPLLGETPLIMLRYKLVSNFTTEDRIQTFITQVLSRKLIQGDTNYSDLPELVSEDFDIDINEARKRVADKLKGINDIRPTLSEGDQFSVQENSGVDIAIFAQHPFYTIHIYRVDSQKTLERIITFVSILFSSPTESLTVSKEAVKDILLSEKKEKDDFESVGDFASVDDFASVNDKNVDEEKKSDKDQSEYFEDLMFDTEQPTLQDEFSTPPEEEFPPIPEESDNFRKRVNADADKSVAISREVQPSAKGEDTSAKGFENYFSDKLKDADRKLFDFHKTHPSLSKYVTQCAANLMRQPAVLTEEQFKQMVKEYEDILKSKEVAFYIFPLSKDAKKEPYNPKTTEHYTLLRYGTSEKNQHYYLCCKYFCTRDNLLVREKELRGTVLRRPVKMADGSYRTIKEAGTCPFCEGKVMKNRRFPGVNETIIERSVKAGTVDKRHEYIRFLKKTNHPDGFYLPCCFIEDQPIRIGDAAFSSPTAKRAPVLLKEEEEEEEEEETTTVLSKKSVSYEDVMLGVAQAYIVGSEKLPLEGIARRFKKIREGKDLEEKLIEPQIGLLPPQLNPYFSQDSIELVSRTFNPQKLKPGAQGFLRIGVDNYPRSANDSLLSAIAPFFRLNSSSDMKKLLSDIIQPKIFMTLNYGNLLLEMYKPTNTERPKLTQEIKDWARDSLQIRKVTTNNEELVIRAYMSYAYFIDWLKGDTKKEMRHFANLFSQGIIETIGQVAETGQQLKGGRGIIFIVLDLLKTGELNVRCPPYPINSSIYKECDIGFLFHHYTGVWEPLFYADNRSPQERESSYLLTFSNSHREKWPKIVQDRVTEMIEQCKSETGGKGFYTSFSGISSKKCIGITTLKGQLDKHKEISIYGIIRDAYNHIAAIVYKSEGLVAIPVVDDGLSSTDGTLILDWDDFTPGPVEQVLSFYKKYIYTHYAQQYTIIKRVKSNGSQRLEAVQLQNGLYVPVSDGINVDLPIVEIEEMEWTINRKIVMGEDIQINDTEIKAKEMNEVYEHLRITFSKWLNTEEDAGDLRRIIEETIYRTDIPLFEKRKRLEIHLATTIEEWMSETDEDKKSASLLRVDCRLKDENECNGQCVWSKGSRCLIHVPKEHTKNVSATHVLLLRLIEELLRYGAKRKQIFDQTVSHLAVLDEPVRKGDQYIVPERSSTWSELLRLEWSEEHTDKPVYLEEMSMVKSSVLESVTNIPNNLKEIIGESTLKLYPSPARTIAPFLPLLDINPADLKIKETAKEFVENDIIRIVSNTKIPIIQIDLRSEPPIILVRQPLRDSMKGYPVFVLRNEYPISILVADPENPTFLEAKQLPAALSTLIKSSKKVFIKVAKE